MNLICKPQGIPYHTEWAESFEQHFIAVGIQLQIRQLFLKSISSLNTSSFLLSDNKFSVWIQAGVKHLKAYQIINLPSYVQG